MSNRIYKKGSAGVLVFTALSLNMGQVNAEEYLPSINYFEAGYANLEKENFLAFNPGYDEQLTGFYVDSRISIFSNIYLNASFTTTETDGPDFDFTRNYNDTSVQFQGSTDYEFDEQKIGVGYWFQIEDNWRVTADLNYLRQRFTADRTGSVTVTGNINDLPAVPNISDQNLTLDGGIARVGVEYGVIPNLTLLGNITYQNITGDGYKLKGYKLNLGANYKISADWSLTGNYQISNENALYLGVRYSF
ncbi:hypothetical protein [Aliiglaciecola sp. M165]|uniref:hypothetical protein n=1 Tax=Aliiglaciecola sp. M165 TaxID=2593649 RepID=UPI00117D607B|nr:hypothetical protein [Aliiglaciecola sp. M165]TRY30175.1 hypothetical protein FM019_15240 [Aliiglaciecola sp. M165]